MEKSDKITQKCSGGNTDPLARFRAICFTSFKEEPVFTDEMNYLIYGSEICPDTGRHHWQGFVYWKNAKTLKASGKKLHRSHCEGMKGSIEQAIDYCKKEGKWKEFGKKPKQGEKKDLDEIKDEIMNGKKVDDIVLESPMIYHQYGRTLNKIEDLAMRKKWRTEMTEGIWYYGKTGVGKSHIAFENYTEVNCYQWVNDGGWWDGYAQQETVIMNDYRGEIPYNMLLQLIDKWPIKVRRRNREPMPFLSKKIIITSSLKPEEVYRHREDEDKIEQLLRRIKVIKLE